ncbi:MAG: toxin-antitoxin system YwqK family antitoxin [Fusobacteriaceae bacterium]
MVKKICFIFIVFNTCIFSNSQPIIEKSLLHIKNGIFIPKGGKTPFTGMATNERDREFYRDGKPHGKWLNFYENGNLKSIESWKDGILNGKHILYNQDEIKLSEIYYRDGNEDGKYILFHDNGIPYIVGEFIDGEASGIWYYYNESGKLTGSNDFRKKIRDKKIKY